MVKTEEINNQNQENITEEIKKWKDISDEFTKELQKEWEDREFNYLETKEWVNIAKLQINDFGYAQWLKEIKKKDAKWVFENGNERELRKEYKEYLNKISNQEWLDDNYSEENRQKIKEIYLNKENLIGELDLSEFTELEKVYISHYVDENKLRMKGKREETKVIKLKSAQTYINWNYLKNFIWRRDAIILNISDKNLEGSLDLSRFTNLKELNCSKNFLTTVILPTNPTNLKKLDLSNNNFPAQDLSFLTKATNLEELYLGNWDEKKINQGIYNRFTGSLDYLNNMKKLIIVNIENTDIDEVNLDKLPNSLKTIWCPVELRTESKLGEIKEELEWWESISHDFTSETKKEWENRGFNYEECKEWIDIGLKVEDAEFASYLYKHHGNSERFLSSLKERGKIKGEIIEVNHFATDFSSNCSVIISTKDDKQGNKKFSASLLVYDTEEKTPWCIKVFSSSFRKEVEDNSELFKEKLKNNENPILALFEVGNKPIYLSKTIKKTSIPISYSDNYAKKYDVIGIKMDRKNDETQPIFLGKNEINEEIEIVHVNSENEINWRAKREIWKDFLKNYEQEEEMVLYHPVISFKKLELIQKHIEIAIGAGYGLGEYNIFGKKGEYFADLCVFGIPFSKQIKRLFLLGWLREGKIGEELLKKEIEESNKYFADLEQGKSLEEINKDYENSRRDNIKIQKKVNEINNTTNEKEIDKILMELIASSRAGSSDLSMAGFTEAIIKLAEEQKVLISSERNRVDNYRNILLIGRTGGGKSTLANVLTGTDEFDESDGMVSKTKTTKSKEFEHERIKYRVVDTIGIGDTRLSEEEVLDRLAKTAHSVKSGLYQILFVVKGRFDDSEKKTYELLKKSIFDDEITKYTTIVRTSFPKFKRPENCKKDFNSLIEESETTADIVNSCNKKVIYVDNPSLDCEAYDDEEIEKHRERREESRKILLNYLKNFEKETYKPENLYKLVIRISNPMTKLEGLEKEMKESEQKLIKGKNDDEKRAIEQRIKETKEKINEVKEEVHKQVKQDLKEKGVYNKLLSEVIEKELNIKWIPYEQFTKIEEIEKGGFGTVFKAKWKGEKNTGLVALKSLDKSQDIDKDFLKEITWHKLTANDFGKHIVKCYGISQNPKTKEYVMVMQYMNNGDLRKFLQNEYNKLSFKDKLAQLRDISQGLNEIHEQKLVHRDFHSGNILNDYTYSSEISCYITDLGLCRPADEEDGEGKIYGVLPYVAPEVLRGQLYTQKSDIYSFGIVAYEILSGLPPYPDIPHDHLLGLKICQGLRPKFDIKTPQLLEDLIKRCWDADPVNRPTARELKNNLGEWYLNITHEKNTEFTCQVEEVEEFNKTLPDQIRFPKYKKHPGAIYTNRPLDFENLPQPQNSQEINDEFYNSRVSLKSVASVGINTVEIDKSDQVQEEKIVQAPLKK